MWLEYVDDRRVLFSSYGFKYVGSYYDVVYYNAGMDEAAFHLGHRMGEVVSCKK